VFSPAGVMDKIPKPSSTKVSQTIRNQFFSNRFHSSSNGTLSLFIERTLSLFIERTLSLFFERIHFSPQLPLTDTL
jgi:hypothetical protein